MTSQVSGPGDWDPEYSDDPEYMEERALDVDPDDTDYDPGAGTSDSWNVKKERAALEEAMLELEVDEAIAEIEAEDAGEGEDWDDDVGDDYGDEDEEADSGFEDVDVEQLPDERDEEDY